MGATLISLHASRSGRLANTRFLDHLAGGPVGDPARRRWSRPASLSTAAADGFPTVIAELTVAGPSAEAVVTADSPWSTALDIPYAPLILENGLIRTLDPQIPTQRALAIAGERIAGGVGVHETALASPEVVDLGGRVVLPGFTDAHVHFPTWALSRTEVALDGCASLDEALERIRVARTAAGGVLRGHGWRSGDWRRREPTAARLDDVTGATPAAMIAKDDHSLWLNSAALALASGDLEVEGGVVERDERGEPTGVLREEAAWRFQERTSGVRTTRTSRRCGPG